MMWDWGWFGGMGVLMLIGMFFVALFWIAVIGVVVWLIIRFAGGGRQPVRRDPYEIVRERYARGEITREQYEEIRRDLAGGSPGPTP